MDSAGDRVHALAHLQEGAGGDLDLLDGKEKAWADRQNWPIALRLKEAASYGLNLEEFVKASDFIDQAVARLYGRTFQSSHQPSQTFSHAKGSAR